MQTPPTAREEQHQHRPAAFVPTEFKPWPECAEDYSECQSMPADHRVPTKAVTEKEMQQAQASGTHLKSAVNLQMTVNTWGKV